MNSRPFFGEETYIQRRNQLKIQLPNTLILLLGNDDSSISFKDNWYPFRQDSSFLYFTGIALPALAILINTSTNEEVLFGDDLSIDDIIWTGPQPTLIELASLAGISKVEPSLKITNYLKGDIAFLPAYRPEHSIKLGSWLVKKPNELSASIALIKAIANIRSIKTDEEITQLHLAATITSRMHRAIITDARQGMHEHQIVGIGQKVLWENYASNSFQPIATVNGNVLHNHYYGNILSEGKMLLFDSGAELANGYCGDMTRTIPAGEKFTTKQKEIYDIVHNAYATAVSLLKPGIQYKDVHLSACLALAEGLKQIGLMKGDMHEAVAAGAHTMFFQCGLGHLIGLDVHDMENLGEQYIGYNESQLKSKEFGLKSLRLGKELAAGFAITVEPGIYIIPELIDLWRSEAKNDAFINYDLLETYKTFGGIRVEDDFVITATGSQLLGEPLAISSDDIEAMRA
jgi:Xaa-Pro aminopeptidase